jgi:GxxExxY protein
MGVSKVDELTRAIIGCAVEVHDVLGPGFLEKVYENALRVELELQGLSCQQQVPVTVMYRGQPVGYYVADLLVEQTVLVEIKALRSLVKDHEIQLVHYPTRPESTTASSSTSAPASTSSAGSENIAPRSRSLPPKWLYMSILSIL